MQIEEGFRQASEHLGGAARRQGTLPIARRARAECRGVEGELHGASLEPQSRESEPSWEKAMHPARLGAGWLGLELVWGDYGLVDEDDGNSLCI
jgi:hypothetical protein